MNQYDVNHKLAHRFFQFYSLATLFVNCPFYFAVFIISICWPCFKLCRELADGSLKAIYVPDQSMEHARSLVRQRHRLVQDQTRCKNRIKHLLMFSGLKSESTNERWSQKYIKELLQLNCGTEELKSALYLDIEEYQHIGKL